jgi:spore coat protein U-like protein
MNPTRVAIIFSLLLWTATALPAQRVQTSYDHTADFSGYRTYSLYSQTAPTSLWDQRVEDAVNSSLAAKGLTQVPSGGDLAIFASDMSQERQKLVTVCNGTRGGWGGGGFGGGPFCDATTTIRIYTVDKLIVNIFDTNSRALLWAASSTDTLSGDSNINTKNLNRDVQELFSRFPPGSRKR